MRAADCCCSDFKKKLFKNTTFTTSYPCPRKVDIVRLNALNVEETA